jgi:hypothetical protein
MMMGQPESDVGCDDEPPQPPKPMMIPVIISECRIK